MQQCDSHLLCTGNVKMCGTQSLTLEVPGYSGGERHAQNTLQDARKAGHIGEGRSI